MGFGLEKARQRPNVNPLKAHGLSQRDNHENPEISEVS
jgi:hypothetical protein